MDTVNNQQLAPVTQSVPSRRKHVFQLVVVGLLCLLVGLAFGIGLAGYKNLPQKNTSTSTKEKKTREKEVKSKDQIIKAEFTNTSGMVMNEVVKNLSNQKTYLTIDNTTYFTITIPSSGYCMGTVPCNYSSNDRFVYVDLSRFKDISGESLSSIVKTLYPQATTTPISFGSYTGLDILGIPSGNGYQLTKNIWFIEKDSVGNNVVYMIGLYGRGQEIYDKEVKSILNSIRIELK